MISKKPTPHSSVLLIIALALASGTGALYASYIFLAALLPPPSLIEENQVLEIDLSNLAPGDLLKASWQGKPIWVLKRTQQMLDELLQHDNQLKDPNSTTHQQPEYAHNSYRSLNPEYLVLIGSCTHLGCLPFLQPKKLNGSLNSAEFFCPCHGSIFDLAGRVFKNSPASLNLAIPPYQFLSHNRILIGNPTVGL